MSIQGKFNPDNMQVLVSPERRQAIDAEALLTSLPITPRDVVADIGCGPGFLTLPLARYLTEGQVHALDIQQKMLDTVQRSLDAEGLTNTAVAQSKENRLPIDDNALDGALLAFVLQEAHDPDALLGEVQRCLNDNGWIAVLEWYKRDMDYGPPVARRINPETMKAKLRDLGFQTPERHELNADQYLMVTRT
ncbi:MAG: class I SAM-dependent methyltransferase [SAR202 cluster bacterium]|nr:class I SAM-dependent methyltransferase [SAR202 cluster bacterium]